MNVELLEKIALWLDGEAAIARGATFYMPMVVSKVSLDVDDNLIHNHENWCGTTCCIAGAAAIITQPHNTAGYFLDGSNSAIWFVGQTALGLNELQAALLFSPEDCDVTNGSGDYIENIDITPDWAARTIRHFIKTGTIDWEANRECSVTTS